ncbi:MAG: haloacid dehalogenase-like hydrolase [Oscillospiraceae bacterium]|nr:haloacid dehalogenase-like hydrolase [Oscillospiraceae bacterium]
MNVYDHDKTIYYPDSSYDFVTYCLRHYPRAVLHALPGLAFTGLLSVRAKVETKEWKEEIFSFLPYLDDVERIVQEFWAEHKQKYQPWYLAQKRPDDLIISASPGFLLQPMCEELGVALIATEMDPYTGKIHGANCHDEEKVRRFREAYPDAQIEGFWSDSKADEPMARLASKAYLVNRDGSRIRWPFL